MKISAIKSTSSCVYCLEFPDGSKYVGKTKNLVKRMKLYEKYGVERGGLVGSKIAEFGIESADVRVLREVKCDDQVDLEICLSILEIKYIRELCTLTPNGLNVSLGGESLGIPAECITTDAEYIKSLSSSSKAILVYDLEGNFVEEYPSIAELSYNKGLDEKYVRDFVGRSKPMKDKWYLREKRYGYVPRKIVVTKYEIKEKVKYKTVVVEHVVEKKVEKFRYTPALKYDMNGDFCGEYASKREASRTFRNGSPVGWGVYCNGYILFKKVDDNYPLKIEDYTILSKKQLRDYYVPAEDLEDIPVRERKVRVALSDGMVKEFVPRCVDGKYTNIKLGFAVEQMSKNGKVKVAEYGSIRDAADATGIAYSGIWACVMGRTSSCAGYRWRKKE